MSFDHTIEFPPVIIYAKPLRIVILARVAIKPGRHPTAQRIPLQRPTNAPTRIAASTASSTLFVFLHTTAPTRPAAQTSDPADRSISPMIMIIVIPTAAIAV